MIHSEFFFFFSFYKRKRFPERAGRNQGLLNQRLLTHASGSTFILFNSQNETMRWEMSSFHEIVKQGWGAQGHHTIYEESIQVVDPVSSPEGVFAKPDAES